MYVYRNLIHNNLKEVPPVITQYNRLQSLYVSSGGNLPDRLTVPTYSIDRLTYLRVCLVATAQALVRQPDQRVQEGVCSRNARLAVRTTRFRSVDSLSLPLSMKHMAGIMTIANVDRGLFYTNLSDFNVYLPNLIFLSVRSIARPTPFILPSTDRGLTQSEPRLSCRGTCV